jgi:hypothetical protein
MLRLKAKRRRPKRRLRKRRAKEVVMRMKRPPSSK